jgi:integrase
MALYKRGRVWWYSFVFDGEHIQESTKQRNLQVARQIEAARRTQLAKGEVGIKDLPKAERLTVGQLLDRLQTDYEMEGKDSAQNRSLLARARKDFGSKMADAVGAEDVDAYIEQRRAKGAADATINRATHLLRAAYRRAKLSPPPIRHLSEKDNVRTGFFSAAEFRDVLSHLPDDGLRDFVLFAYLCGWRKGSVASLRWVDVDLMGGEINLPGKYTKNGEPLKMPIEGELKELMKRRKEARAVKTDNGTVISALVFHRGGKAVGEIRKSWATATRLANCSGKLFHDFRRTAARDLIRSGAGESVAMCITGHKTNSMFKRYNITDTEDVRAALRGVGKYRTEQQQKIHSISK